MGEFPNTETQFKKGEGGRPKGSKNRSTIYREFLEQVAVKSFNKRLDAALEGTALANAPKTIQEQIIASLVLSALAGDVAAAKELMDSAHGKLTDKVAMTQTVTAMGKVTVETEDKTTGERKEIPLTFNVGSEPDQPEEEENHE